jgi:glycosyltransferase involved in cell wall biosynthesis
MTPVEQKRAELAAQIAKVAPSELAAGMGALRQRLGEAVRVLLPGTMVNESDSASDLLALLVAQVKRGLRADEAWLVLTAATTVFPPEEVVLGFLRTAELRGVDETTLWLLGRTIRSVRFAGALDRDVVIVCEGVVLDVDFAAKYEHNSGIQRVVRRTVPIWAKNHDLTLVAWGDKNISWVALTGEQRDRVLLWDSRSRHREVSHEPSPRTPLVIPWKSTVLLVEVPNKVEHCLPLAAMARLSGNVVNGIGYDVIPITSAETVPIDMSDHFAKYLAIVKYMRVVAGISRTAADEFAGFAAMLPAQGLVGPEIVSCVLPSDETHTVEPKPTNARPLVVCVGSKEPRKNHVAVLAAAEQLWNEGLDFELFFIGIVGWDARQFKDWERRLAREGRPVRAPARVGDGELWRAYADARFTIFPSLHEGYGLPVAESLAYGTPVIATNYGSTAEIAELGGCLLVDPRSDASVTDAMRLLLTDDEKLGQLQREARLRPSRSWEQYAAELWSHLVVAS